MSLKTKARKGIVLVGAFGLIGFAFIDNAAHLGGLAGGLLLGWFLLRGNERRIKARKKVLKFGGPVALLALAFIAAFAVYRMMF